MDMLTWAAGSIDADGRAKRIGLRSIRLPAARPTEKGAAACRLGLIMPARHQSGNRRAAAASNLYPGNIDG
ncbi:hypothetical protein [Burkholderia ubonensis]|uniref:hypothetical protein n=1 Tax=Burkholderia ubonensis TaxID=101571 RepID=UPI0012FC0F23|nr:hypothetical protein [Burkholderia ubonensis]